MDRLSKPAEHRRADNTLAGGGEMGRLMREHDWAATPLGPVNRWPQSLRTAVSICLASRFPIIIFWFQYPQAGPDNTRSAVAPLEQEDTQKICKGQVNGDWGQELRQFYNDAYRPILGMTKHPQALGQGAKECWPEIWNEIGPMLHTVLTTGESTWSENLLLLLDRNGYVEECYFTFSYSPIRDETGEVGGVFCAVTETTKEVLGERRLRTLRVLAADTAEADSPEEVCCIAADILADDPDDLPFTLLYLLAAEGNSAHLAATTGIASGTLATPMTLALDDPEAAWPLAQVTETGLVAQIDELAARFGDISGPLHDAERLTPQTALILPIARAGQDRPYGFLIAGISPRRLLDEDYRGFLQLLAGQIATACASARAYQEAQERAAALAELDRAKTAFFNNISHEFRTPLTLLLGPLDTVLSDPNHCLDPAYRTQLEMVRRNGLRQLKLVNTLLDFSRIEAGRAEAVYEPTDLASLTADLASTFRSLIESAGLRLIVDCPPLPEPIYVDRDMWEKIVLNLLSNAFKFTFEGEIRVQLRLVDEHVELTVADTGVGIAETEQSHLFERFYRVRGVRARTSEGSGIGLSLVQELVRLHGGTIEASSEIGRGTTFTVRLPRGRAHLSAERIETTRTLTPTALGSAPYVEEARHWLPEVAGVPGAVGVEEHLLQDLPRTKAIARSGLSSARLLIVDDNADMRDYLTHLLSPFYILQTVADGATALSLARSWSPDLILADVMMPGLDGFALLAALRADARTSAVPVILLSARAGEEATIEGLRAGTNDYLVKPFSARELLARVEAQLEIAHLRQQLVDRANAEAQAREATLRADHQRMVKLIELAHDAVIVRDPKSVIQFWNHGAQYLYGWTEQEAIGQVSHTLLSTHFSTSREEVDAVLAETGEWEGVLTHRRSDGEEVIVESRQVLVRDMQDEPSAVLEINRDITARERLQQERTEALARELAAREASRRTDEFIGITSHELKTPLTTIKGNLQLARRRIRTVLREMSAANERLLRLLEEVQTMLDRAERQVDIQNRLVRDLVDTSRIQAEKLELRIVTTDLVTIVRNAVEDQHFAAPARAIAFQTSLLEVSVLADAERIGQVVTNYLSNALKYSPEDSPVTVRLTADEHEARVEVIDEGPGLAAEQQTRIWERFYRVPEIRVQSGSGVGLGLGLHICRMLIEQHGGHIGVESTPGKGSTFWFTLPLRREDQEGSPDSPHV